MKVPYLTRGDFVSNPKHSLFVLKAKFCVHLIPSHESRQWQANSTTPVLKQMHLLELKIAGIRPNFPTMREQPGQAIAP